MDAISAVGLFDSVTGNRSSQNNNDANSLGKEEAFIRRQAKVEALVAKRLSNLDYLKDAHNGETFWLNCVLLTHADLKEAEMKMISEERKQQLFYFGISLGRLLDRAPSGPSLVRGTLQLLEEMDHYFSPQTQKNIKLVLARPIDSKFPTWEAGDFMTGDSTGRQAENFPGLQRYRNHIVYNHFVSPPINFELDYFQILISLCETLSFLYKKFMDTSCSLDYSTFEALIKVDQKLKHFFLNPIARGLTDIASSIAQMDFQEFLSS
mmetsp:Transcript_25570/g.33447  ORF Transcript_25570/g.33447 Transcript_25570/m.33447 type:complete len:265 (+) Transcript_25570:2-796(+)